MDRWVSNPNTVRVVALFLAIMLWAIVRYNNSATILPSKPIDGVPVQVAFNQEQYFAQMNVEVVQIQGKQVDLLKLKSSSFQIVADATQLGAGKHQVKLMMKNPPQGINVKIVPESIEVNLEKLRSTELVINTQLNGKLADGFTAANPILSSKSVKVLATSAQIKSIKSAFVTINVDGAKESITSKESIRILDVNGKELDHRLEPSEVDVTVEVKELFKKIPLAVTIGEWPENGYAVDAVELAPSEIEVYANQEKLKSTSVYQTEGLELDGKTESQFVQLDVPVYDGYRKVIPDQVEANVKIVRSTSTTFSNLPIEVRGLSKALRFEWIDSIVKDRMDITVEGSPRILDQLNLSDMRLYVDLNGLGAGSHLVQVKSQAPNWVRVLSAMPQVMVRISE